MLGKPQVLNYKTADSSTFYFNYNQLNDKLIGWLTDGTTYYMHPSFHFRTLCYKNDKDSTIDLKTWWLIPFLFSSLTKALFFLFIFACLMLVAAAQLQAKPTINASDLPDTDTAEAIPYVFDLHVESFSGSHFLGKFILCNRFYYRHSPGALPSSLSVCSGTRNPYRITGWHPIRWLILYQCPSHTKNF